VVDARRYGGTCARRGCQPKKYLVAAAEVVGASRDLTGLGIETPARLHWPSLMRHKREFTDAVPDRTERGFEKAGIATLHGRARFTGPDTVRIEGEETVIVEAATVVIATGARPRPLDLPGAELMVTSEQFLELDELPRRLVCTGGGYISLEFAHVAARAGVAVTVLHRGSRILERFDADLIGRLAEASAEAGIVIRTDTTVAGVERHGQELIVRTDDGATHPADLVLHGAGRVPELDDLDLDAAGIAHDEHGVLVGDDLRSTNTGHVFAVGDVAATGPMLAPTADLEGEVAAANIIAGRSVRTLDRSLVPSAVFTQPPLASVGMTAAEAAGAGDAVVVNEGDMARWPSARRRGQKHAAYKVIQAVADGRILGAHVLAPEAADLINVFTLAIRQGLTGADLQAIPWAYPTSTSDLKHMVVARPGD
jgi:glutathione reductase (NADPH)